MTDRPPLTMKRLDAKFDRLRRFVGWAIVGFALIAVGAAGAEAVFILNAAHEKDRTCAHVDQAITATVDALLFKVPATRTKSLPPRTPDEQKRFDEVVRVTHKTVRDALATCGD